MPLVTVNLTKMFAHREPWDCSNSVANLGDQAGRLTWQCATETAERPDWLVSSLEDALAYVRADAGDTGAWDRDEIAAWSDTDCLAYLVQSCASDLRLLGSDDHDIDECLSVYETTDWDKESEYPLCVLYREGAEVHAQLMR